MAIDDAVTALKDYGRQARLLAGGTDLLVGMQDGLASPTYVVDIKHIPELRMIALSKDGALTIGACVTINRLAGFKGLPPGMEALRQAASVLGTNQVRNRATVGGNLCNASPACDLGPPLLVLGARLHLRSAGGERQVDLKDWFTCPKQTCLGESEMLVEIEVPAAEDTVSAFVKRQRIRGHDLALVNAAATLRGGKDLRIAVGAVAPTPLLIEGLKGLADGRHKDILRAVSAALAPIDDVRASGLYRKHMATHLVTELLAGLRQ
jgi:CO/xanthine dehydrogenase FAD-binding subunit